MVVVGLVGQRRGDLVQTKLAELEHGPRVEGKMSTWQQTSHGHVIGDRPYAADAFVAADSVVHELRNSYRSW